MGFRAHVQDASSIVVGVFYSSCMPPPTLESSGLFRMARVRSLASPCCTSWTRACVFEASEELDAPIQQFPYF